MKKPAKSNMFLNAKLESLAPFDAAIDGDVDALACIVSYGALPSEVRTAFDAACNGVGMPGPVYLDVSQLSPADAFAALEGLDPEAIIVADDVAASLLAQAYRANVQVDACGRLFGRPCVAFTSFQADLAQERTKQRDWALLKMLRRSSERRKHA